MRYEIRYNNRFLKRTKRLKAKFASFYEDLKRLIESLELRPRQGNHLGNNFYKVRLSIKSKGKGKSGGVRVITYVSDRCVYLATIYDKSTGENISSRDLADLLSDLT